MFLWVSLSLEIGPYSLSVSTAWDVLVRQALEFCSWMCLAPLTCRFPSVLWPGIFIWDKYCVVAAQIFRRGVDEVWEDGKRKYITTLNSQAKGLPCLCRVPNYVFYKFFPFFFVSSSDKTRLGSEVSVGLLGLLWPAHITAVAVVPLDGWWRGMFSLMANCCSWLKRWREPVR